MGLVRKGFGNVPLKDLTMERKKVEEFEESLCEDCGWINLIFLLGFSLKNISRSSLHFVGIRGIYTRVKMECEELGFSKQSWLAAWTRAWLSRECQLRGNWTASLYFLSCSAPAGITLQHLACLTCVQLLAACKPRATREIQSRVLVSLHNHEHFFTLSHILPLYDSHLNTRLLIAKIQENLA